MRASRAPVAFCSAMMRAVVMVIGETTASRIHSRACANVSFLHLHSRARVWQVLDGRELAPRLPLRLPRARMTGFRRSKDICARERSVLAGRRRALAMSLGLPVAVYPAVAPSLSALYSFSSSSKIATNRFVRNGSCWMLSAVAAISSIAFSQ